MSYATPTDLDRVWGIAQIDLVSIDASLGRRDDAKIAAALDDAGAQIDSYCARRYPLPLALSDSGALLAAGTACDLAVYRLATTAGRMTEIIQRRYDQALAWLRDIAAGRADLALAVAQGAPEAPISPNEAVLASDPRFFTRETLRGY